MSFAQLSSVLKIYTGFFAGLCGVGRLYRDRVPLEITISTSQPARGRNGPAAQQESHDRRLQEDFRAVPAVPVPLKSRITPQLCIRCKIVDLNFYEGVLTGRFDPAQLFYGFHSKTARLPEEDATSFSHYDKASASVQCILSMALSTLWRSTMMGPYKERK